MSRWEGEMLMNGRDAAPASDEERQLRENARRAIEAAKMPSRRADRTWGGPGLGAPCTICGIPVLPHEIELELEFVSGSTVENHHVHVRCFEAWEHERDTGSRVLNGSVPAGQSTPGNECRALEVCDRDPPAALSTPPSNDKIAAIRLVESKHNQPP